MKLMSQIKVNLPGFQSPAVGCDEPFEMLIACHERVQRMLDLYSPKFSQCFHLCLMYSIGAWPLMSQTISSFTERMLSPKGSTPEPLKNKPF